MPEIGCRYVFFLKRLEEQALQIVTAYELREGKAYPLDDFREAMKYQNWDESEFLTELTNKLRS